MSEPGEGLRQLRKTYAAFWAIVVFFGVVVAAVHHSDAVMPWLAIVAGVGAAVTVLAIRFEIALVTTDADALAESYRARFFLRIAVAEPTVLVGLLAGLKFGPWWLYLIALAFTAIGFVRAAPSDAAIARDQARLDAAGCTLDLVSALQQMPARKRG